MKHIHQQGEVKIVPIDEIPENVQPHQPELDRRNRPIISHSDKGHNHVIDGGNCALLEPPSDDIPQGMQIIYLLVEETTSLLHDASDGHEKHTIEPGTYALKVGREFNPFLEEARQVKD